MEQFIVYKKISDSDMRLIPIPITASEINNYISTVFDEDEKEDVQYCEHGLFMKLYPTHYKQIFNYNRLKLIENFFSQREWITFDKPIITQHRELNYKMFIIYENDDSSFVIHFHINCNIDIRSRLYYETMTYLREVGIALVEGEQFCIDPGNNFIFGEKALRYHLYYKNFCQN